MRAEPPQPSPSAATATATGGLQPSPVPPRPAAVPHTERPVSRSTHQHTTATGASGFALLALTLGSQKKAGLRFHGSPTQHQRHIQGAQQLAPRANPILCSFSFTPCLPATALHRKEPCVGYRPQVYGDKVPQSQCTAPAAAPELIPFQLPLRGRRSAPHHHPREHSHRG